jgi:hypothetical protein
LSIYRQIAAVKILTKIKVLIVKRAGIPSKNYYRVDIQLINKTINQLYSI